jgi:hypothetical protein
MTDRWQQLQDEIGVFTEKTFPGATAKSKALHLAEEAHEAAADPGDVIEWADCLILLLDGARRSGFSTDDLFAAVQRKMEINKKRTWGAADENGVFRHVKTAG